MVSRNRTEETYFYERWRAIAFGMLETGGTTFLLLIAVRRFEAGWIAKGLVAGGGAMGLLFTPLVVSMVQRSGWPAARAASRIALCGAGVLLVMASIPWLPLFVVGSVLAMAAASSAIPLMTQVYQDNYPESERGRRFSRTVMIRIATAALFSELAGKALSGHIEYYRGLLVVFAAAFVAASYCLHHCPSQPLTEASGSHPFRTLHFVQKDRLFRQTLICWMLMGFANLMMLPMRVEYLANPRFGLALKVSQIAFYVGVLPNCVRLLLSPVWGWLFDRMNFFVLRLTLNLGYALGILAFFTSHDTSGLVLGAIAYGASNAGGDVAWGLWVTKFAPPDRVADYMSVHTFFTGVRGVLAPLVAFHLVNRLSMGTLGGVTIVLILAASLLLVPEIKFGRTARPGAATSEDISE